MPAFTFDAENHLITAGGQTYLYDGDGKRAEKASGSPLTANKLYWYGTEDSPVLETDAAGNELYRYFRFQGLLTTREEANDWVDHYGLDALGNVRWLYSLNGAWDVSDYYPFGGERIWQSNSTNTRKFTSKERDSESNLDNFGARYDSSSIGRFMSSDPANAGVSVDNPQSWNAYSYVLNNPLKYVDPHGLDCIYLNDAGNGVDHIKSGDCVSETDNGYYVDSKEGTVTSQDVSFSKDNNTIVVGFSSENDLPGLGHFQQFCTGSCPDNSVTVSTGLGDPIPTTMSALRGGLMPTSISAQQIAQQAGFDFWKLTPAQRSQIQSCLSFTDPDAVLGGGPVPFDSVSEAEGQKAAQVQTDSGQGLTYRNGKPIVPNIKGAKRAGGVSGAAGALGSLAGAAGCVQNVLQ